MKDTYQKFSTATIALHWLVGVVIIGMLAVGWVMAHYEVFFLYPIHKSVGVLIFAVIIARVWWRALNGFPSPIGNAPNWQRRAARIVHWILLAGSVVMPLTGIVMTVLAGRALAVFGVELVAANLDPLTGDPVALAKPIAGAVHELHHLVGRLMIAAVILHILAAIKHHFVNKDETVRRMLGKRVS